jgi:four helix bundle protein
MFDFEKLDIFKKAKFFNASVRELFRTKNLDSVTTNQLRRASFSIVLNIAEGSGRFSKKDRRNFFVISRSSVFECVAILDILKDEQVLSASEFQDFYDNAETLSKILFTMIRNLEK